MSVNVGRLLGTASGVSGLLVIAACTAGEVALSCDLGVDPAVLADRPSPYDSLAIWVGESRAQLCYSRPYARGRAIFGGLVPFDTLWRTGANEPTILHLPFPALVAGLAVEPGLYSVYTVPRAQGDWTLVLNASVTQWGLTRDEVGPAGVLQRNAYTDQVRAQEVGRVPLTVQPIPHVEQLTASLQRVDSTRSRLLVEWETTRVIVPIERIAGGGG